MNILPHALLSQYTTFKLGGPCRYLIECATPDALQQAVQELVSTDTPYLLIGGGSNLVVSDRGIDVVVIRYASSAPLIERRGDDLWTAACTELDAVALASVDEGLDGFVQMSGIPGTVGGAVVGNAGAWGKQVGDVLKSALILDSKGKTKTVGADYFGFTYRNSKLKDNGEIVVHAIFGLCGGDPVSLAKQRADILKLREEKHPSLQTQPCAGSFFRNIEPTSKAEKRQAAGWFLEQAGGKDLSAGGAYIYDKHANIIIKGPTATAQDVHDLHLKMIEVVQKKFSFLLHREVRFVGSFDNAPQGRKNGFW